MKTFKKLIALFTFLIPTLAWAADAYEEVSYDDLVNQISKRKSQAVLNSNGTSFDSLMIHAGFGLVSTASSISYGGKSNLKYQNGFQLSMGIDLFSPNWATEAALRNFGQASSGSETRSLREFDMKIFYREASLNKAGFRMGMGLGTRYFKLSDSVNGVSIDDTTPTAILFGGIDVFASRNVSLGVEAGLRSAMITSTADKNSFDAALRLDTYF